MATGEWLATVERRDPEGGTALLRVSDEVSELLAGSALEACRVDVVKLARLDDLLPVARRSAPKLVLLDASLEGADMDLLPELILGIQKLGLPQSPRVMVIAGEMAGQAATDRCFEAGCDDLLFRPLSRDRLLRRVEAHVSTPIRAHYRVTTELPVQVQVGDRSYTGTVRDLSQGGLFIAMEVPPPPGRNLRFELELGALGTLEGWAKVLRVELGRGMGLRFLDVGRRGERMLAQYVRETVIHNGTLTALLNGSSAQKVAPVVLQPYLTGARNLATLRQERAAENRAVEGWRIEADALRAYLYELCGVLVSQPAPAGEWLAALAKLVGDVRTHTQGVVTQLDAAAPSAGEVATRQAEALRRLSRELDGHVEDLSHARRPANTPQLTRDQAVSAACTRIRTFIRARRAGQRVSGQHALAAFCGTLKPWELRLLERGIGGDGSGLENGAAVEHKVRSLICCFVGLRLVLAEGQHAVETRLSRRPRRPDPAVLSDLRAFAGRYLRLSEATLRETSKLLSKAGGVRVLPHGRQLLAARLHALRALFRLRTLYDAHRRDEDPVYFDSFHDGDELSLALRAVEERPADEVDSGDEAPAKMRSGVFGWLTGRRGQA